MVAALAAPIQFLVGAIVGAPAIAISAYLAAVYLCDDAQRRGESDLVEPYRRRALAAGTVAGLLAVAAALAVAAIVAGWALAQQPQLLPGLTVDQAAAPRDVLVAVIVAVAGGGIVVIPSLLVLLRLPVAGRLGEYGADGDSVDPRNGPVRTLRLHPARAGRLAAACIIGGFGFLTVADAGWAHAIGVTMLFAAIALGLAAAAPRLLEDNGPDGSSRSRAASGSSGSPTSRSSW